MANVETVVKLTSSPLVQNREQMAEACEPLHPERAAAFRDEIRTITEQHFRDDLTN